MQFGVNFHAGSKKEAHTRLNGVVSLPASIASLAHTAVDTLGGDPSIIRVAVAGEEKKDKGVTALNLTVTA